MDAYMVLAHCPATGRSYGLVPCRGPYENLAPLMFDQLLNALSWQKIDARGFVFDVLACSNASMVFVPHREFSYEEVRRMAARNLPLRKSHEPA